MYLILALAFVLRVFWLSNYPTGSSTTWSKSSNLTYVSSTNTSYTTNDNGNGEGWIQSSIDNSLYYPIIIRKDLWKKHKFDESLSECEDYEWSKYWKSKRYRIINDPRFRVYHSHGLSFFEIIRRQIEWRKSTKEIDRHTSY